MNNVPRIKTVAPLDNLRLHVVFENDVQKEYDCSQLLSRTPFQSLQDAAFFGLVKVDTGGYGISWNADIDLSEFELWTNGKELRKGRVRGARSKY